MARCDDLATQLSGLQNQLSGLQNQLSDLQSQLSDLEYQQKHPKEACADQDLTGIDCELYLRGLGPQIRSTESQISGVQGQIAGVQAQITNVQQQQQKYWCSPVFGPDGTPLTITTDDQGNVTVAQAVGTDGVKRSFIRIPTSKQNKQGWYYTVMRQEFFENDQRYFYVTSWIYVWGRRVSVSMSGGGKDYGFSFNFPDDSSHDSVPITIASGAMGQPFTVTQGTLNLNQGSISAPVFTGDFTLPAEIEQQTSKTTYFQQLFDLESVQFQAEETSALQAAGLNANMTLNEILYDAKSVGNAIASAVCWGVGGAVGVFVGTKLGKYAGAVVGGVVGSACDRAVDWYFRQPTPPPPPPPDPGSPMTSMPSDPSVQMDGGDPMSPGGDPGGMCIGPPVTSEQRVIGPLDDFVCV